MRLLVAVMLVALLAPSASAHGTNQLPPAYAAEFNVNGTAPLGILVSTPGPLEPGDLMLVNLVNEGPNAVYVQAYTDYVWQASWEVPADGATHVLQAVVQSGGAWDLDLLAQGGDGAAATVGLFVDYTANCNRDIVRCSAKMLAWDIPGGRTAFPFVPSQDGTYTASWSHPPVHDLEVSVVDANLQPVAARMTRTSASYQATWDAVADSKYFLVAESTRTYPDAFAEHGYSYDAARIYVNVEGPLEPNTTPGFSVAFVILGLLVAARLR